MHVVKLRGSSVAEKTSHLGPTARVYADKTLCTNAAKA